MLKVCWTEVLWQQVVAEVRMTGRAMVLVVVHVCTGLPLHMTETHLQAQWTGVYVQLTLTCGDFSCRGSCPYLATTS